MSRSSRPSWPWCSSSATLRSGSTPSESSRTPSGSSGRPQRRKGRWCTPTSSPAWHSSPHSSWPSPRRTRSLLLAFLTAVAVAPIGFTYSRAALLGFAFAVVIIGSGLLTGPSASPVPPRRPGPVSEPRSPPWCGARRLGLRTQQSVTARSGSQLATDRGWLIHEANVLIREHPVVGVGPGRYVLALRDKYHHEPNPKVGVFKPVHNLPLLLTAEGGIPAGLVMTLLLVVVGWQAFRSGGWRSPVRRLPSRSPSWTTCRTPSRRASSSPASGWGSSTCSHGNVRSRRHGPDERHTIVSEHREPQPFQVGESHRQRAVPVIHDIADAKPRQVGGVGTGARRRTPAPARARAPGGRWGREGVRPGASRDSGRPGAVHDRVMVDERRSQQGGVLAPGRPRRRPPSCPSTTAAGGSGGPPLSWLEANRAYARPGGGMVGNAAGRRSSTRAAVTTGITHGGVSPTGTAPRRTASPGRGR